MQNTELVHTANPNVPSQLFFEAMIDDTKHLENGIKASSINLSSNIDEILKYQVVRAHAERWSHDLRFLTFDDSGLSHDEQEPIKSQEPDDEIEEIRSTPDPIIGQCQRCELRTPVPSGHQCESHFRVKPDNKRERALREYANPCVHVCELACAHCQHIPLFPNQGTVTTFKIRRIDPKAWTRCRHFVAISYCWSAQKLEPDDSPKARYQVIEEDGKPRNMRANSSIIDRAVDFARQNGFRMIWIDQVYDLGQILRQATDLAIRNVSSKTRNKKESWQSKQWIWCI